MARQRHPGGLNSARGVRRHIALAAFAAAGFASFVTSLAVLATTGNPVRGQSDPVPPPTLSAAERHELFVAGPIWDGRGSGNITATAAASATTFPLVWFGPDFAGFNAQGIDRVAYEPPPGSPYPPGDSVSIGYGRCTDPPCEMPISIHLQSICQVPREALAPSIRAMPERVLQGGAVLRDLTEDSVLIWTGQTAITLHMAGAPERIADAWRELRPLDAEQDEGDLAALSSPDWSECRSSK